MTYLEVGFGIFEREIQQNKSSTELLVMRNASPFYTACGNLLRARAAPKRVQGEVQATARARARDECEVPRHHHELSLDDGRWRGHLI
jgi:hypothetical protein